MPFIAILDDQPTNRQIFSRLAASVATGVEVEAYADPVEALQALALRTPDLVITDFKMPFMDGAEFVKYFRELPGAADVPVVVLTVYEERGLRLKALECGATDFLQSPVDHQEFVTRARNLLKLRYQQLQLETRAHQLSADLAVSERSREQAMRDSRERMAQVIDSIPAVVRCADGQGALMFVNAYQAELFSVSTEALNGRRLEEFLGAEQAARSAALDRLVFDSGRPAPSFEEEITDATGQQRVFLSSKSPLRDGAGEICGVLTTSIDITERKLAERHLQHAAHHDALTGLPNRLALQQRIQREVARARRGDRPFALHLLDLDNFKAVNDLKGHAGGDQLLCEVARRLTETLGENAFVARLGGDEFAVLQTQFQTVETVREHCDRMLAALAKPFRFEDVSVVCTASIGVASHPGDGADAASLMSSADTAMYRAKSEGGNRARFSASELQAAALKNALLDAELRHALDRNEFVLHFQPQLSARSGRVIGAEALLRWNKPGAGLLSPGHFLPRAESTGFIVAINDWVLAEATRAARRWQRAGLDTVRVGVNLSPLQFSRRNVPLMVAKALAESGLPANLLDLELTETSVLEDSETIVTDLTQLQELGCEISIDDFGTGYSSLSYVKRLPADRLKIDQSFIRQVPGDPNDVAIVRSVIALGHSLDLEIVAEGVETQEQADFLKAEGCDAFQGYLFAKPMPFEAFLSFGLGAADAAACA